MRQNTIIAAAAAAGLLLHSPASAQMSPDEAHARVNRLLNGAGSVLLFTSGRTIHTGHKTVTSPRSRGRCMTVFGETYPDIPSIPESYRGKVGDEAEHRWSEVTTISVSGDEVFYDQIRKASGRPFTYHFQFNSPTEANEFAEAARVLAKECGGMSGAAEQPLEERVFDREAGSASLAIDRRQGARYGWAIDYPGSPQSDARALEECQRNGGRCQVVLRFTGGCGAYAADQAKGSTVYGWGLGTSRQAAEGRAWDEARKRGATNPVTRVWGCNSDKAPGGAGRSSAGSAPKATSGESTSGARALPGRGKLSEDVIRRNEEAARAHRQQVEEFEQKKRAAQQQLEQAVAQRKATDEAHQRELAKARAAKEQYERERQAYREEYKRVTGRYPDE